MTEVEIASRHFWPGRAGPRSQRDNEALEREGRTDYHYRVRPAVRGPFRWFVVLEEGPARTYPRDLQALARAGAAVDHPPSGSDYEAQRAERYGWINRALPADALCQAGPVQVVSPEGPST